jgi:hypothetical protein
MLYIDALRFKLNPPKDAGNPIYLYSSNPVIAGIAFKFGETNGICNPPIAGRQILAARSPRLMRPREIGSNQGESTIPAIFAALRGIG